MLLRRLPRTRRSDDDGFALLTVIGVGTVMTALMLVALGYAAQAMPQARYDQDWNAALAAAQAGVDDYVARLNQADSYALTVDCTNNALQGPAAGPNSCGWTSSTPAGWKTVNVGDTAKVPGQFHYDAAYASGYVQLKSTGRVNNAYRTIDVQVARSGSTDFLYYTDFENADPANKIVYPGGTSDDCGGSGTGSTKYWYEKASGFSGTLSPTSTTGHRASCTEIAFGGTDVLNGPVHFNDTPGIAGATTGTTNRTVFSQGYETSDPNCKAPNTGTIGYCWRISPYGAANGTAAGRPIFTTGGPKYVPAYQLPDNSADFVNYPGCQYYGDTRIRFNSNGTMTVWNTLSSGKPILGPGSPAGTNCGNASNFKPTNASDPRPPASAGQTVPVPSDLVIYVRNSGSSNTCRPGQIVNGSSSGSNPNDVIPLGSGNDVTENLDANYYNPDSATQTTKRVFTKSSSGGSGYNWVPAGTQTPTNAITADDHAATLDCGQGNVYVEGTVKGRITVAAENNVVVTDDLLLASTSAGNAPTGTDMTGLVAGNSVQVYHPVTRSRTSTVTSVSSPAGITCGSAVNSSPTTTPTGSSPSSVTCTWTDKDTFASDSNANPYSNLTFDGMTAASDTRYVYASIQTLQHSFFVQYYNRGSNGTATPNGTLYINGSLAQRYRGIVSSTDGYGSGGYRKSYNYDNRLKYSAPPYFPQWTNATWGAKRTGELKPMYKP